MNPNKPIIEFLKTEEYAVALPVILTKKEVDSHLEKAGKSPLTVDQWDRVVSLLEGGGLVEADWANVDWCIEEMESEVLK